MLSPASQLALKNAVGSMFAWTNSRLRKPAANNEITSKGRGIFQVVMTPDRIPKFFIPSLDVKHVEFHLKSVKVPEDGTLHRQLSDAVNGKPPLIQSKSESSSKKKRVNKRETVCQKDYVYLNCLADSKDIQEAMYLSDPVTQAALSLLHLPKVTTPYGFLTLGESPIIQRKESLFFEPESTHLRALLLRRKDITGLHNCSLSPVDTPGYQNDNS